MDLAIPAREIMIGWINACADAQRRIVVGDRMDDQTIISALDEKWRTVSQIKSRISGRASDSQELASTLRRLAEAGQIEKFTQPTMAPRRSITAPPLAIELFRLKLRESPS